MAAKPEWGSKHTCPKCGERFYDLGKPSPVVCIACETSWTPEPVLKSKQPMAAPAPKPVAEKPKEEADEAAVEGDDPGKAKADDADDAGEDDKDDGVLGDVSLDDDKTDLAEVADAKLDTADGS